ncbi:MAG: peptidoglycan-binding protein [Acidimicrobiales bacterium]
MRIRITALATLAVVAVLIVASVGVVISQRRLLTANLDESLATRADEIQTLVADGRVPPTLTGLGEDDTAAQVLVAGSVVVSSTNVAGAGPIAPPPSGGQTVRTVTGLPHDDASFRLVSRQVEEGGRPVVIHVAGNVDDIHDNTTVLVTSLSVAVPAVALLLALLIWWLVGRTLRPVEAIRAEVAAIGGSDLQRRVPVPTGDDEIARLARTMNTMLERVDAAAQAQARFVADASHELRSPLTRMRSELEVDLAHADGADLTATHRSILEETVGMQHLVEDLLLLARSGGGPAPAPLPVDLDDIVVGLARRLRADGRVTVDMADVAAVQVPGHAAQLARAVSNLADNAARHAAGTVTFLLVEQDGLAELAVIDDGPGIPPEDRERVFERFTRLDEARGASTGGAGLGLAIARDIVERHGGTVSVDPDHRPGARLVVTLPLGPSGPLSGAAGPESDPAAKPGMAGADRKGQNGRGDNARVSLAAAVAGPRRKAVTEMALNWPLLKKGQPAPGPMTVEPIRTLQYLLRQHGHPEVAADGIFGPITEAAVRSFQQSHGLTVDGVVGNQTWPALIAQVQQGSQGEAVRGVQSQFQARNLSGDPSKGLQVDGIFGPKTDAAVRGFQQAAGLGSDGIVGPLTWNALVNGVLAL